ncbi:Biosynthetic peptidoglycan transglycosylase [Streptomyces glaucescens]
MGRAEERRARQRGGRRAAPRRRRSSGAAGKSGIRRLFTWKKILGTFLGVCLLGIGAFVVLYLLIDIPQGNALAKEQGNVYQYSDGTTLARKGLNREVVDLAEVPKPVQKAFVAAENKSFYSDSGVDLKGTARGVLNTLSGKGKQGGSTITQQYVKNYYLTQEQTVSRKLKELIISLKVDRQMSKDAILAGYMNTSFYGRDAYGIQAAAQSYYRVDAEDLTLEQGAYLAALLQAPNSYDWSIASPTGKKLVRERWDYVLDNMVEEGWLDAGKRSGMKFPVPKEPKAAPGMEGQNGYIVEEANRELAGQLVAQGAAADMEEALTKIKRGGWTITVNIDSKKQKQLERAVEDQLTRKLDPKQRKADADVQAGAASVDPRTGRVLAMYGGVDYVEHYTNNATRDDYQPASTFKPMILAAALEEGATTQDGTPIRANTLYDGDSERPVVDNGVRVGFAPENEDHVDYGDITVQQAMNQSVNSVFAQMGVDVGMQRVLDTAGLASAWTPKAWRRSPPRPSARWARARWRWPAPTPPSPTTARRSRAARHGRRARRRRPGRTPRSTSLRAPPGRTCAQSGGERGQFGRLGLEDGQEAAVRVPLLRDPVGAAQPQHHRAGGPLVADRQRVAQIDQDRVGEGRHGRPAQPHHDLVQVDAAGDPPGRGAHEAQPVAVPAHGCGPAGRQALAAAALLLQARLGRDAFRSGARPVVPHARFQARGRRVQLLGGGRLGVLGSGAVGTGRHRRARGRLTGAAGLGLG